MPLTMRSCTQTELGLGPDGFDDPQSKFYTAHSNSIMWLQKYQKKLNCVDENIVISGNYQSLKASHLQIQLQKCDNLTRSDCKSDEEITQWLRRKFIVVVNNSDRFNQEDYTDNKVVRESVFTWFPIKSTSREEIVNEITIEELQLQNSPFQFSDLTEVETELFSIKKVGTRPYEFDDKIHHSISYEMNLDLLATDRELYSILDWIGDLGGLYDGLKLFFVALISFFNYNLYSSYMVAQLFMTQRESSTNQ